MNQNTIARGGYEEYFNKDAMLVNINVSDICNFSCSYCINIMSKKKQRRVLDKNILEQFIEDLEEYRRDAYHINVAGGEPLVYPHIQLLVKKIAGTISARETVIAFATNGSRLKEKGEELYAAAGGGKTQIFHFRTYGTD